MVKWTLYPLLASSTASAAAMVVFPTPPLPMVMMTPLPRAIRSGIRAASDDGRFVSFCVWSAAFPKFIRFPQVTKCADSDERLRDQRHVDPCKTLETTRHVSNCLASSLLQSNCDGVVHRARLKDAINNQLLILQTKRIKLVAGSFSLGESRAVRTTNQEDGCSGCVR